METKIIQNPLVALSKLCYGIHYYNHGILLHRWQYAELSTYLQFDEMANLFVVCLDYVFFKI